MRKAVWTVFPCLTLFLLFPSAGTADDRFVCGFNHSGMSLDQWAQRNANRTSFNAAPLSDYEILREIQNATNTNFGPDERKDLGFPPVIWLIQGASNAFAGRVSEGPDGRSVQVLLDDDWIRGMDDDPSNTWVRKTVIAHELGHLAHGDVWGQGASTRWRQEYQADEFAGFAMCKLGAPQDSVREFYRVISWDSTSEDSNSHPSRTFRLRAVAEGYSRGGCS